MEKLSVNEINDIKKIIQEKYVKIDELKQIINDYYCEINKLELKLSNGCKHVKKTEYNYNEKRKFCIICDLYL